MGKKNRYGDQSKERAHQKKMVNKGIITGREFEENMRYYKSKRRS